MTTKTNTSTEEMQSASAKAATPKRARAASKKIEPASPESVAPAKVEESAPAAKSKRNVTADAVSPIVPEVDTFVKPKKTKLVRDSFTMPGEEYQALASIKKRCLEAGVAVKKSEVLRVAVKSLAGLSDEAIVAAVQGLTTIKTGRPARNTK